MASVLAPCPNWPMVFPNDAAWLLVLLWVSTRVAFLSALAQSRRLLCSGSSQLIHFQHQKAPLCICLVRKEVTHWHFICRANDKVSRVNSSAINEDLLSPQAELGKYLRKVSSMHCPLFLTGKVGNKERI